MFKLKSVCAGATLVILAFPAAAAEPQLSSQEQKAYNMLAKMSEQERQKILHKLAQEKADSTGNISRSSQPAKRRPESTPFPMAATQEAKSSEIPILSKSNANSVYRNCVGFIPLLRQDWKDIEFASCPQPVDKAAGAQFSVTDDFVKHNTTWVTHGTVALLYNAPGAGSYYTSTGVYATVDRSMNSAQAQASKNSDTLAYGGVFEFGSANNTLPYVANYFRVRGGGVEDHIKNTTAGNVTFEWLPVYEDGTIHIHSPFNPIPGLPLIVRFDPVLLVQYAAVTGSKQLLAFNNMPDALRVGPQLTLNIYPGTDPILSHFHGSVTYHWAYETYSGRGLDYFQTNLTYNLDAAGYFGLTGSYKRGHDEDTGAKANVYMVSLSGKI